MTTQQPPSSSSEKSNINLIELKETVDRIASYNGVEIVQILNTSGDIMAECINSNNNIRSPMAGTPSSHTVSNEFFSDSNSTGNAATGNSIATTMSHNVSLSTASAAHCLLQTAQRFVKSCKTENENEDEINFVQIRSKNGHELMIAPHFGFALVVVKTIA